MTLVYVFGSGECEQLGKQRYSHKVTLFKVLETISHLSLRNQERFHFSIKDCTPPGVSLRSSVEECIPWHYLIMERSTPGAAMMMALLEERDLKTVLIK